MKTRAVRLCLLAFAVGVYDGFVPLTTATAAEPDNRSLLAWYQSIYTKSYAKHNTQQNSWNQDALKVLDMAAHRHAGTADKPSQDELGSMAKSVIDAGCNDPLIYYVYYIHLRATGRKGPDGELDGPGETWLRKALDGFRRADYPQCLVMKAALSVALLEKRQRNGLTDQSRSLASEAVNSAIQAILAREYLHPNGVPVREKFTSDLEYLRDMCRQAGLDTAEAFQRIIDRVGGNADSNMLDELDTIASHERIPDHREWETLERKARRLLRTEQFDELDAMASELRTQKSRFQDGEWKAVRFYDGLALPFKSAPEDWTNRFELVEHWTNARPASVPARLVLARTYSEYAWNARGGGYANNVTPERRKLFSERLAKAHDVLNDIHVDMREDPEWYRLMLMVLADSGQMDKYQKCLRKGLALEPDYDWFDKLTAWFSLPRWYGNAGDWLKVAEAAAARTAAEDGDSSYTRVAWHIWNSVDGANSQINSSFLADNQVSWPRLCQGFRDMEKYYPGSLWNMNVFCRFACMAKDKKTARELFDRIGKNWDIDIWSNRLQYQAWSGWAHTKD
jgi:hypothetical protein